MTATSPARVVGAPTSLWNPSHGAALLAAGMAPRALRAAVMAFTSLDDYLGAPNDRLQAAGVPRIAPAEWRCPPEAFVVLVGHPGYPRGWPRVRARRRCSSGSAMHQLS